MSARPCEAGRRRMRLGYRTKLALAFGTVIALSTLVTTVRLYRTAERSLVREFGQKLLSIVSTAAPTLDGEALGGLADPSQMTTADYQAVQRAIRAVREANPHVPLRYVYTLRPTGTGPDEYVYLVDAAEPGTDDFSALGDLDTYDDMPEMRQAIDRPVVSDGLTTSEEWGTLLTAAAPVHDRTGRAVGIFAVDASLEAVQATGRRIRLIAVWCLGLGLVFALLVSQLLARGFTRPILQLVAGTEAVAAGDLDHRVDIRTRDELGELGDSFNAMIRGLRERELYREQFERYVSRQVADQILEFPERVFWGGERRTATILFVDIRDFTTLSETLPPEQLLQRVNSLMGEVIDIIFEHEGTLDKFIGDGIMAVFGAPLSHVNDEERAARAALAIHQAVDRLATGWRDDGLEPLRIGVGINTGEVVVGNIGSERRLEYSALGDAVNVAARVEGLNKVYRTGILLTASTLHPIRSLAEVRFVDRVQVKGREEPVEVFELLAMGEREAA